MIDPISLTTAQDEVARQILEFGAGRTPHALATLAGYAGVGKTTVVAHVVRALATDGVRMAVCAPTHKALSVLGDKLGTDDIETMTLQSALALKVREKPDGTQDAEDSGEPGSLRDFELAVVDESSMVSPGMFATALSKRGRCRILFIGDPAQLPPVDQADARTGDAASTSTALSPVFGQLVPLHWQLTEVVRQARENPIIRMATAARECITAGAEFGLHTMADLLQPADDSFMALQPGGLVEVSRLVADAIAHGQDTRALAFDNATVQAINANVHAAVFPGQGDYPKDTMLMAQDGFTGFVPGTERGLPRRVPVRNSAMLTVRSCTCEPNPADTAREAYKLVLDTDTGSQVACWVAADQRKWQADISECFAEYRRLKLREQMAGGREKEELRRQAGTASRAGWELKARFAPVRYAYAMTVHKAQGSTFDAVVLDWASFQRSRDLQLRNRLVYVALTRTRRFAVVCA